MLINILRGKCSQAAATLTRDSGQSTWRMRFGRACADALMSAWCSRRTERKSSMMALFSASCFSKSSRSAASAPPSVALPNSWTALNGFNQALVWNLCLCTLPYRELLAKVFMRFGTAILRALQCRALRSESCEQTVVGCSQLPLLLQRPVRALLQRTHLSWPRQISHSLHMNGRKNV